MRKQRLSNSPRTSAVTPGGVNSARPPTCIGCSRDSPNSNSESVGEATG